MSVLLIYENCLRIQNVSTKLEKVVRIVRARRFSIREWNNIWLTKYAFILRTQTEWYSLWIESSTSRHFSPPKHQKNNGTYQHLAVEMKIANIKYTWDVENGVVKCSKLVAGNWNIPDCVCDFAHLLHWMSWINSKAKQIIVIPAKQTMQAKRIFIEKI